jgi:non-specific serine/threonine protein kinase
MNEQDAMTLLALAESAVQRERGLDGKAAFAELEQRYPDLLDALRWLLKHNRGDGALRLTSALAPFWTATQRLQEGVKWAELAVASSGGAPVHRGRALFDAGFMNY